MATRVEATVVAMIPDFADLGTKYPRHVGMAQGTMGQVWELATDPKTFLVARAFATLGFPPVTAIADDVATAHQAGRINAPWDLTKQFSGVAIAVLMEANGYRNLGRKRGVPHANWNVGTCFAPLEAGTAAPQTQDAAEALNPEVTA